MKDSTLKVLFTFATSTAMVASMQAVALADDTTTSTNVTSTTTGIVTADVLNVRANPNTSSSVIGSYTQNTKVTVLAISNGWYKVNYNNKTGWISGDYVTLTQAKPEAEKTSSGVVTADVLNIRSGAGTNYSILGTLKKSSKVEIVSSTTGWYKIKFNSSYGYVSSTYVSQSPNTNDSNNNNNNSNNDNNNSDNNNNNNSTGTIIGSVTADALNVRGGAGTNYAVLKTLPFGTNVEILSTSNGWHKIKFNSLVGYVSSSYIKVLSNSGNTGTPDKDETTNEPSHTIQGKIAIVTTDALNIRSGAGTSHSIVSTARYGYKLPIISYSNGWYEVKSGNITGFISGDYISIANEGDVITPLVKETALIDINYTVEDIVNKAKEYIGVPYLWGGFTPVGFDCSGLVQYVYKQFGVNLERTTYYQVHQGQVVQRNALLPGDLIFFTTNDDDPNDISHVGLYVGNDLFIQAPKPGDTVRISSLNSAYYTNRYYVAKRIIK